ncbi:Zinc finger RING-type, partial [Trinorchestia longiramus]
MVDGSESGEAEQCPICLNDYALKTKTSCGHSFCCNCILHVLDHHNRMNKPLECPYCKQHMKFLRMKEPGCYVLPCSSELDDRATVLLTRQLDTVKSLNFDQVSIHAPYTILRFILRVHHSVEGILNAIPQGIDNTCTVYLSLESFEQVLLIAFSAAIVSKSTWEEGLLEYELLCRKGNGLSMADAEEFGHSSGTSLVPGSFCLRTLSSCTCTLYNDSAVMDSGNAEEENVCYICLGPIRFMGTTDCNHAYCRDCIMKALSYDHRENRDLKCPYCRQTVSKVYSCLEREFEAVVFRENREIKLEELSATNENLTEKLARAAEKNVELAEENARLREKNVKLTQKLEVERRKKPVVPQQRDEMYLDREHVVNVLAAIEKDLQSIS